MLISEAIPRAYREAAITRIGATLTADEIAEGLQRVNDFLASLFGEEIGEKLMDYPFPPNVRNTPYAADPIALPYPQNLSAYSQPFEPLLSTSSLPATLPQNSRILWRGTSAQTLYMPEQPSDGARIGFADVGSTATLTLNGNGRSIAGSLSVDLTNATVPTEWFYRADLGRWIVLTDLLVETDESPLPAAFDGLVVSGTAIRLTALDEIQVRDGTKFIYERLLKRAKARYTQHNSTTFGGENLRQSFIGFNQDQNSGNPFR